MQKRFVRLTLTRGWSVLGLAWLMALSLSLVAAPKASAMGRPRPELPALETVRPFDLNRYLGKWYEIARIPQSFQKNCEKTTAEYSLRDDGSVRVLNRCFNVVSGEWKQAEGRATVPNRADPSKLKVSFFWPFSGNYWVIELGADYDYAVVGDPSREYLWVLSRQSSMDEVQLEEILARCEAKGFDTSRMVRTDHNL
jgi:apolipoprotein D and lipocalin family protein